MSPLMSRAVFALAGLAAGLLSALGVTAAIDKPSTLLAEAQAQLTAAETQRLALDGKLTKALASEASLIDRVADLEAELAAGEKGQPATKRREPDWAKVRKGSLKEFWYLGRTWKYESDVVVLSRQAEAFTAGDPDVRMLLVFWDTPSQDELLSFARQQRFSDDGRWFDHGPGGSAGNERIPVISHYRYLGKDLGGINYNADGSVESESTQIIGGPVRDLFFGSSPTPVQETWYEPHASDPAFKTELSRGRRINPVGTRPKVAVR